MTIDSEPRNIYQIECAVQRYAWGKTGRQGSLVYALQQQQQQQQQGSASPGYDEPHAEFWMGTHVNGPSRVVVSSEAEGAQPLLSDFLSERQEDGWKGQENATGQLPFLFKVLSVGKALSIQCHPDKQRAQRMHAESPQNYKDPNHKPELCVALTDFEGLCGFRPWKEIAGHVSRVAPLKKLLDLTLKKSASESNVDDVLQKSSQVGSAQSIRTLFSALMQSESSDVTTYLRLIVSQIKDSEDSADKLLLRLSGQYPNDVGCLAVYFLNRVTLKAGEGLFMGPNEPHAYLDGDIIECMACSDNVVRAGLTPKFRDVKALCEMLTYRDDSLENGGMHLGHGTQLDDRVSLYQPPVEFPEFQVYRVNGNATVNVQTVSIALVISGSGSITAKTPTEGNATTVDMSSGKVFVIKGGCDVSIEVLKGSDVPQPIVFIASARG